MREILFRAKCINNGQWVYGYYSCDSGKYHFIKSIDDYLDYRIDPYTLGQFTGQNAACKDSQEQICRKQQVFEHDILADQNGNILGCVRFTDEHGWMVGVESLYDYTDRYD